MSKNFRKSDYARNKMNKTAIVYEREVITYEKVTITQPEYTQDRFMDLKKDSDEDLRIIDRRNTVESKHIKCSIDEVKHSEELITKSCEEEYMDKVDRNDRIRKFYLAMSMLTDVQKRRMEMYFEHGLTLDEIAKIECCNINAVKKSIKQARQKFDAVFDHGSNT